MKKLVLILALSFAAMISPAQNGGGLFQRGQEVKETTRGGGFPGLPGHGEEGDQPAPVGAGTAFFISFGAAYALYKKKSGK